jgi:phage baseplate assembly protein W
MAYTFTDLDLTFQKHPGTKDVLKKFDVEAVKQSLKTILVTNPFEKKFDPNFGVGIYGYLFENFTPPMVRVLERKIIEQIEEYEPRAVLESVKIDDNTDRNEISVVLNFYVIGNNTPQQLNIALKRVR